MASAARTAPKGAEQKEKKEKSARGLFFFATRAATDIEEARTRLVRAKVKRIRTALRRVRAICESLSTVDDAKDLRTLRKMARTTMRALGPLRDHHVKCEVLESVVGKPLPPSLNRVLRNEERVHQRTARQAVLDIDLDAFLALAFAIDARVKRVGDDHLAFLHLGRERLEACRSLLVHARRGIERMDPPHDLRIGLKRFRYIVESFLPSAHADIGVLLKQIQTVLGDIHDLDVVRETLDAHRARIMGARRTRALARIRRRRRALVREFLRLDKRGLLRPLFRPLPSGQRRVAAAWARIELFLHARGAAAEIGHRATAYLDAIGGVLGGVAGGAPTHTTGRRPRFVDAAVHAIADDDDSLSPSKDVRRRRRQRLRALAQLPPPSPLNATLLHDAAALAFVTSASLSMSPADVDDEKRERKKRRKQQERRAKRERRDRRRERGREKDPKKEKNGSRRKRPRKGRPENVVPPLSDDDQTPHASSPQLTASIVVAVELARHPSIRSLRVFVAGRSLVVVMRSSLPVALSARARAQLEDATGLSLTSVRIIDGDTTDTTSM